MGKVIPMSWLNQILLILSISCVLLSLVIEKWAGLTSLPIYVSISWAIFILIASMWLSCYLFQLALKANRPLDIKFLNDWLHRKLITDLKLQDLENEIECNDKNENEVRGAQEKKKSSGPKDISSRRKRARDIFNLTQEIDAKCINVWYKSISEDNEFPNEARELLKKLLTKLFQRITAIDKVKLTHKLSNVFLLHLKEYHKALRRVEKGTAQNLEEAFKYLHPGSRNPSTLEHMLHRTVTILAQEFLQWELTSSLPCKLLLSILAKRLLIVIETVSSPNWLFQSVSDLLELIPEKFKIESTNETVSDSQRIVSNALEDGMASATAAVIPRPLPRAKSESSNGSSTENRNPSLLSVNNRRPSLRLDNLATEHRGLWGQSLVEIDGEEDKISPVYEEPTDFATTIARLRTVLLQKSTVNTPLQVEEKSCVVYEGSQFTNLTISWTEFHTALDGSQQLLYCIQFDDVEQRGVDLFVTTTATVRRQYRDFAQLHASLQEIPELAPIMSNLVLPEGGRVELENYLKTLTTRLANECPPQLRHFLRPSSNANKKADVVAPRFDKFLVKTVSGVFNTLRTVVPGFEAEEEELVPLPTLMPLADIPWRFVEDIKSSLSSGLKQLIAERTEYSCVDSAYEAVDSMDGSNDSALLNHWLEIVKSADEEDVDELDSHLTLTSVTVDLICELLAGIRSNNAIQQEAVVRWSKLVFGNVTESILQTAVLRIFDRLGDTSFYKIREELSEEPFVTVKERLLREIFGNVPNDVKMVFGDEDTLNILRYLLESCEIKKLNIDLNLRILDVLASQLLISCRS
ncbi:uncharacterized protein LOC108627419 isoform X2 [Ceratina calcarata]|uniref:Uncharacterized protein LOC108627419 isoform X2 n=1 Tax=Ceratina calcarata TaxID=156304 RepID=A0AAJ7J4P8_9HYME|nr:uncharacterized protein LOC108627419 isoform X2 [Ceratina calcarata]